MIDVWIKLRPTPRGFTRARVAVMGSDTDRPKVFNSLHPSRDEALHEALLLAKAEAEDVANRPWASLGRIEREVEEMGE